MQRPISCKAARETSRGGVAGGAAVSAPLAFRGQLFDREPLGRICPGIDPID